MTATPANGYSSDVTQSVLSNENQHGRVKMVIKDICIFVHWTKVALAMDGLKRCVRCALKE